MDIESFIKAPYPIVIHESPKKVLIFVPKLFITVESDTLLSAYELCQKEKSNFYRRLEAIDGLHLIPSVSDHIPLKKRYDLQKIIIERFISFSIALFLGIVLIVILGGQVKKVARKVNEAFTPVSNERQEVRLQRFKEKLNVAAPYIKEVKKVFNE